MSFSFVGSRRAMLLKVTSAGFALSAALLLSVSSGQSAPKKSSQKTAKPAAKKAAKLALPVVAGLKPKGKGECLLQAKITGQGANLVQTSFASSRRDKFDYITSTGQAIVNNNIALLIMLPQTEKHEISAQLSTAMAGTLTFASRQGFKAGQTLPIEPPTSKKVGTGIPICIMDLVQHEIKSKKNPRQYSMGGTKIRSSTWIADGGVVRLISVSPQRITFSINARLKAPESKGNSQNQARGRLTFNGIGEFTITEVDDGFY